jgi:hypothetical protein
VRAIVMMMIKTVAEGLKKTRTNPTLKEPEFVFIQETSYILSRHIMSNLLNTTEINYYKRWAS